MLKETTLNARPTSRAPELEYCDFSEFLRFLSHGAPCPLIRWHYHDAYELHYIAASSGKLFIGDYIGSFEPGNLVLTGPRLPHNWISTDVPEGGIETRDFAVQFDHPPLENAAKFIPELREVMPLLDRAKYGIEFFGMSAQAERYFLRMRDSSGLARFTVFLEFIGALSECKDYRLLSSASIQSFDDEDLLAKIDEVVNYITDNYSKEISADTLATQLGMSPSKFSRFFKRATGNSFTDFVNRIRINKACQLLMNTDEYVTNICYDVGFNNVANFNRRFLEVKGVTPKQFREHAEGRFGEKAYRSA